MKTFPMRGTLLALCLFIIIGPLSLLAGTGQASAKVSRVAIATKVSGTVSVLKSGGAKAFKAFKNMTLNEGDLLRTGKDGSIVLELSSAAADQDTVTIGANSEVSFTNLKDEKGTKTKLSVWAGSLWVKVKSVSNADDRFEVETPTSIMGVRGTKFLVVVDPKTGFSQVVLAAGVIESSANKPFVDTTGTSQLGNSMTIYPTQQIVQLPTNEGVRVGESIVDVNALINQISPDIIAAILTDAQTIREEQELMIQKWKQQMNLSGLLGANSPIQSQEDLNRWAANMSNFLSQVAQQALAQEKFDEAELRQLIDSINQQAGELLIDLNKDTALSLSEKEKLQQEKVKELQKKNNQKAAEIEKKKKELEQEQKLDSLKQTLQDAKNRLDQQNQALESVQSQAAKVEYEKQNGTSTSTGSSSNSVNSGQAAPNLSLGLGGTNPNNQIILQPNSSLNVPIDIQLSGFNGLTVYGYQLELEYTGSIATFNKSLYDSSDYRAIRKAEPFKIEPEGETVTEAKSVDQVKDLAGPNPNRTLVYSAAAVPSITGVQFSSATTVRFPFTIASTGTVTFHVKSVKFFDKDGNSIQVAAGNDLTIEIVNP